MFFSLSMVKLDDKHCLLRCRASTMKCEGLEFQSLWERLRFFVLFIEIKEYFFHRLNNQKEKCFSFLFTYTWSMEWYFVYNNTAYQNGIWKKFMALDVVHWMILDYLDYSNILCLQLVHLSNSLQVW